MTSDKIIMGLDIGSSMVRAVVGTLGRDGQLMVDNLCERPSEGVRNGVIVNVEQTLKTVSSIIQESELQVGAEIQFVVTGIGGSTIKGRQSEGVAGINSKDQEISTSDIYKSLEVARTFDLPQDRTILHTLVQDFSVDGKSGIKDPTAMNGHRLESRALVVTGSQLVCQNTKKCIQRAGITNCRLVLQQLADAEIVLNSDDKEMGTILINIGSNITNMIVYQHGSPVFVGGVDLGGNSVTNDIATLLNKPRSVAEQVKCEYGCCYYNSARPEEKVYIKQPGNLPTIEMPRTELCKIIEPRMAEIFSLLQNQLVKNGVRGTFGGGIVLVGGGSLLSGVTELSSEIFGIQSRIGFPEALPGLNRSYINPKYSTVLGLLKTEAKKSVSGLNNINRSSKSSSDGFFQKLANFFKTVV